VQPVVVREISGVDGGGYEIIAGERRCRAARIAGLTTIPAIVRSMADRQAMAVALVENIQRADLNPLEEAEALRRLIDDCGLTHDDAAAAIGRSRTAVTNLLRVIDLEPETRELLRSGALTLGHAKVLLSLEGPPQIALARRVVEAGLSVRATEQALRQTANVPQPRKSPAAAVAEGDAQRLSAAIGVPVKVEHRLNGTGRLVLRFSNRDEFGRLLERLAPER
jgi:ParB family chromosome partitioning protein